MSDLKINCPKCGEHVAFPPELAGQAAACPHCQEPIVLGSKSRVLLWTALGTGVLCCLIALAAFFWHLGKSGGSTDPVHRPPAEATRVFEKNANTAAAEAPASEDDRAIEALCRAFYARSNEKDFEAMHQMVATPCKTTVTPAVLDKSFSQGFSFRFIGIDSITYTQGPAGKLAKARLRRVALDATSEAEGVREFKCVKEPGGWKLFRDLEWMSQIVSDFERFGFTEPLRTNVHLFCASNPFDKWPPNETNAFEKIYRTIYAGAKEVFPWNLALTVETNYIDSLMLNVVYSVHNNADRPWENGVLDLDLKQGGKVVLHTFELLQTVGPGNEVRREASFFLKTPPQESTRFDLDASYTLNGQKCKVASGIPVGIKVQKLTESLKVEVVGKSFDTSKNTAGDNMLVARVDYRVRNVSKEPLKAIQLKFVWSSLSGEVLYQGTEYVVGFTDLPLGPQQVKSGFTHCDVGYSDSRVPVKVDIYLEDGERHWPLYKGLLVQ
jgi:hypothetical protein